MSIYDIITNLIVEEIERNNILPWEKEWSCNTIPVNTVSQKPYRGVNLLLLPQTPSNEFTTWSQLCDLRKSDGNLKLKKGCKQHMVVFYSIIKDKLSEADNEEEQKEKGFLKYYKVFAIEDVDGLESRRKITCNNHNPIEEAENLINSYLHNEKRLNRLSKTANCLPLIASNIGVKLLNKKQALTLNFMVCVKLMLLC